MIDNYLKVDNQKVKKSSYPFINSTAHKLLTWEMLADLCFVKSEERALQG